jgi:SNF2 family DNA or RNA helicase
MRRRLGELKVAPVVELLKTQLAESDEKVVVFAHHRPVLEALRIALDDFGVEYIDGDTRYRDEAIDRFRHAPGRRVFLGQNIACSTGMDGLQYSGARRVILVEPDWTPDVNLQLGKRVARMGAADGKIIVQMIALAGTLDEAIVAQNKRETEMVAQAMPAGV